MKMKTSNLFFVFAVAAMFFAKPMTSTALNYYIAFTGTGASTTVDSVIVQNLTKGTTVTVPSGNVLNLSDITTAVQNPNETAENIRIYPNPIVENTLKNVLLSNIGNAPLKKYKPNVFLPIYDNRRL